MTAEAKLIDYFLICGLDPDIGIEADRNSNAKFRGEPIPPLDRGYVAKVLAHFPDLREGNPFSEAVLPLCMPKGLRFCTQKDLPDPEFHSFVNIREDRSRISGCALVFYEKVTDLKILAAMHTLHTLHFAELTNANQSGVPMQNGSAKPNSQSHSHTLPRRGRTDHKSKRASFYDTQKDSLFVSKAIVITCAIPIVTAGESVLRSLYRLMTSRQPPILPLECYVYWVLHEIPLPPPSRSLKFTLENEDVVCQRPGVMELPFFDHPLIEAFDLLGLDNFLKVYVCVLLEQQILLCSKVFQRLMLVAESLTELLFPFRWQHVYVPILPYSQASFMEAPVPYIMGFYYEDSTPEVQANICVVNIDDGGHVDQPEDMPQMPDKEEIKRELDAVMKKFAQSNQVAVECRRQEYQLKRMSRSFDEDSLLLQQNLYNSPPPPSVGANRQNLPPLPLAVLEESESFKRAAAIAKKVGVHVPMDSIHQEIETKNAYKNSPVCQKYFHTMKFNNALREVFLNRFCYLLLSYEQFVVGMDAYNDRESFLSGREFAQNFDKASFLSDQSQSHLTFLAAFIETQMFASFIDDKILSQWEQPDPYLKLFDSRISHLPERYGDAMVRTPTYEFCPMFNVTEDMISRREESLDYVVPGPHKLEGFEASQYSPHSNGEFPILNRQLLNNVSTDRLQKSPWRQRHSRDRVSRQRDQLERSEKHLATVGNLSKSFRNSYQPGLEVDQTPAQVAQTNWKFVEQLLRETKAKTKRMLVEKLGREAVELGHADLSINGVEENTLVASFCDLLERVWSHGLNKKQGKSSLWTHLLSNHDTERTGDLNSKVVNPAYLTPETLRSQKIMNYIQSVQKEVIKVGAPGQKTLIKAASFICDKLDFSPPWNGGNLSGGVGSEPSSPTKQRSGSSGSRPRSPDGGPQLRPLPTHIAYDLRNVLKMSEIKTDIGYARAFVRLALERKLLHKHVKTLLSNQELLRAMYKRYAFLRCEEEREQFLYHILSLNAADYRCFTNTFSRTKMTYMVLIVPGGKFVNGVPVTIWMKLGGTLVVQTPAIAVPKTTTQFSFDSRNLGILSTLRIGHDTSGSVSKWYLECVIVRNEITGHACKFPCARWFGRGVDDGSTERLLFAEPMVSNAEPQDYSTHGSLPRTRSPSARRSNDHSQKLRVPEIQHLLGEAVNSIVKYFYKPDQQRSNLTQLMCGDRGLVWCLEQAFLVGFRSSRLFKQLYCWDYIDRLSAWFNELLVEENGSSLEKDCRTLMTRCIQLTSKINANGTLGKEGKFQTFILITIRDHILTGILPLMAWSPVTLSLYEENSFIRSPLYLTFLTKLLTSLNEFDFKLEQSLTWGIDA